MNIAMFTRVMPAHCKGGMQDHILMLSEKIAEKGHTVVVITTKHPKGKIYEEVNGVKIHYLPTTITGSYFRGGWWEKSVDKFMELHSLKPFDIVHSQSAGGYYFLKKGLNKKCSLPSIVSMHGTTYDEIKTRLRLMSIKAPVHYIKSIGFILDHIYQYFIYGLPLIRLSDAVISTSNEQAVIIKKIFFINEAKIFKVFNGIDPTPFSPRKNEIIRQKHNIAPGENLLLSIARLEKDKGIQNIIYAFPEILKIFPDTKLMIVGDGSYAPELRKRVKKLNLENNVIFTGMLSFESLPDYFNACDLFVNPTIRQNGYDLTILEAMACEKPVVVSNIGSVPTVIEDGVDGLLVPTGDIKKLAEAVRKVLTDKELAQRLGKAARKKIVEKFSVESMVEGTIKVYEEVIRRNKEKLNQYQYV
jgi:glycosyltransferase involved in cell wall biosynthesis